MISRLLASQLRTVTRGKPGTRDFQIQALLFERKLWTVANAKAWAKRHKYRYGDVDVSAKYIHLRQRDPKDFKRSSIRTVNFGKGIKARFGHVR